MSIYRAWSQEFQINPGSERWWSITKYDDRIRKQWTLSFRESGVVEVAAYFRTEEMARTFANDLGLRLTEVDQ